MASCGRCFDRPIVSHCLGTNASNHLSRLLLLSQKVADDAEENHLFGKIHTSAMGGWNGSAQIKRW